MRGEVVMTIRERWEPSKAQKEGKPNKLAKTRNGDVHV
jgi:hypothetical protein